MPPVLMDFEDLFCLDEASLAFGVDDDDEFSSDMVTATVDASCESVGLLVIVDIKVVLSGIDSDELRDDELDVPDVDETAELLVLGSADDDSLLELLELLLELLLALLELLLCVVGFAEELDWVLVLEVELELELELELLELEAELDDDEVLSDSTSLLEYTKKALLPPQFSWP